jgi:hypothetical protein
MNLEFLQLGAAPTLLREINFLKGEANVSETPYSQT